MNRQLVFDTVARHLLAQGVACIDLYDRTGTNVCRYRNNSGLKCAIGCLIPDERYGEWIEGASVNSERVLDAIDPAYGPIMKGTTDFQLLSRLQSVHDYRPVDTWYARLADVAVDFGLNCDALAPQEEMA